MKLCLGSGFIWMLLIAAYLSAFSFTTAQQDVMFVKTAAEFQEAVTLGIRHIIIQRHLDLRTLTADPAAKVPGALLVIASKTKSIRGACTGIELDNVTLDPQTTAIGQCVLRVSTPVFELSSVSSELLLSDVYVRMERTAAQLASFVAIMTVNSGSAWITTTVLRGDRSNCRGIEIGRGQKVHARKSFFVGFQAEDSAAIRVAAGARGGFKDCTFNINAATLHGSSVGMDSGGVRDVASACWFQSCIFSSNADSQGYGVSQTDNRALHYNNRAFQKSVNAQNGGLLVPEPIDFDNLNALGFLIANADSYREIASEQARLTNLQPVEITSVDTAIIDEDEGSPNIGAIVGGILAAVVVVTAVALAAFVIVRRRRKLRNAQKHLVEPVHDDGLHGKEGGPRSSVRITRDATNHSLGSKPDSTVSARYQMYSKDHSVTSDEAARAAVLHGSFPDHGGHNDSAYRTFYSQTQDKTASHRSAGSFTRPGSHLGGLMDGECLEEALDDIFERRILFLGRFELYSQVHRRVGGQGVVQPARGRYDEEEYAIKFFLNRASFKREEALYLREDLRRMMPAVKDIVANNEGAICDMAGRMFPPAIVIERGEPLDEWALRIEPDFPTILTVLCHILARLQQLHSVGIAHRDIKPGNVLWRPKHHSWTLIDFGCAAEIGQTCPLSLSLLYSSPEAMQALEAGVKTTVADPATDMWALGVISFELLTASRTFARSMSSEEIRAAVAGRAPLPWETPDFRKKNVPELRMLRRSVLSCLNRDPQRRPTSTTLLQSWNGLFDQATKGTLTEDDPENAILDSFPMSAGFRIH